MAETHHSIRFKLILLFSILLVSLGGGVTGCAGSLGLVGGANFAPNLLNAGQPNDPNQDTSDSENNDPNKPSSPPLSTGPSSPKGSPGTLIISSGSSPSGQPTEIAAGPMITPCLGQTVCQTHVSPGWERTISGRVLPPDSSADSCQDPFNFPITVTLMEKKLGETEWKPSQDPHDQVWGDEWGRFSHDLSMKIEKGQCLRSVKYHVSYIWQGATFSLETEVLNCDTPPALQTMPALNACETNPPDGGKDDLEDGPPHKGGKQVDEGPFPNWGGYTP